MNAIKFHLNKLLPTQWIYKLQFSIHFNKNVIARTELDSELDSLRKKLSHANEVELIEQKTDGFDW